jgi:hypothetical protein
VVPGHLELDVADQIVDLAARLQLADVCFRAERPGLFLIEGEDAQSMVELASL